MANQTVWGENFTPEQQAKAQQMNDCEERVPPYSVPGPESATAAEFLQKERKELLKKLGRYLYGPIPGRCRYLDFDVVSEEPDAFDGLATRRQIVIRCSNGGQARFLNMLLYIPNRRKKPVPVFFGMNLRGTHAGTFDPLVRYTVTKRYPTLGGFIRFSDRRAREDQRGMEASRWDHEKVLKRGYAVATINYCDVYPDHPLGFPDSVLAMFFDEKTFQSPERPCGAISAWAWGYSRAIDCLEAQPEIDRNHIAIHGLSRLGKTALWAGANDERAALTVSCCSGTLGAKLSHRYFGEDFSWIDLWNPHWVVPEFRNWVDRDLEIPVEQNQLLACIAPRLLFIMSAEEDTYADPKGEFLSAVHASKFYRLFGSEGIGTDQRPPVGKLLTGDIGYFLQEKEHNFHPSGWDALLDYTDLHWGIHASQENER